MRGKIRDIIPLFGTHSILSIEVDSVDESWRGQDLSIEIKPWRNRRSLSANAYFHVLCDQLAKAVGSSLTEVKNQLISDYGQYSFVDTNGMMEIETLFLREDVNHLKLAELHLSPTGEAMTVDGQSYLKYYVMRGSHTYDSKEMADLINGTTSECKEVGVKTLDDLEIERMLKNWQNH